VELDGVVVLNDSLNETHPFVPAQDPRVGITQEERLSEVAIPNILAVGHQVEDLARFGPDAEGKPIP